MNKYILITLLLTACVFCEEPEYEEKDSVLVLTDANLEAVVNHFEHVLVMFYAPWCGHCKKLHPEYEAAAQQLEQDGSAIRLATLDSTVHTAQAQKHEVKGYPTLKFFINGTPMDYSGPREKAGIVKWVLKKTQPATTLLETSDAVEQAKTNNDVVVVFFGAEDSDEFAVHSTVAKQFDDLLFHHVVSSEVATEFGVEGTGLVVFKQFDEGRNNFDGDWTTEVLNAFVETSSTPTIIPFDQKAAQLIFGQGKTCLFVFVEEGEDSEAARAALEEASTTLKGQVLMSTSGVTGGLDARLAEYIGVTSSDVPAVRLVEVGQELSKYNLEGEITAESIVQFWQDFEAGNLQKSLKSEPVPETQEHAVHVVVGDSWNDVVMDETQDVLVEYYAPWCGHCKALAPIYEALAQKLSVVDNLVIAKMDSTANEAEGVNIKGFPTLKFYPANNKTPVDFSGNRDEEGLLSFLREKSSRVVNWDQLDNASDETADEAAEQGNEEVKDEL